MIILQQSSFLEVD